MWQEERHQRIRALLGTFERVSTERIAAELGVSRETVRRDLLELEARGELKRVHGGVVATEAGAEPPLSIRATVRVKEKRAIAKAALHLLRAGQTLFLDAGSTTSILAEELAALSGLRIVTNSVQAATAISANPGNSERGTSVHLLGGSFDSALASTYGEATIGEIHRFRCDLALLSPVGLDGRYGATSFDPHEAEIARAMSACADQTIILADHGKWGQTSRIAYCPPERIAVTVTDAGASRLPEFDSLRRKFPHVVIA